MRMRLAMVVVALQALMLAFMAGQREWVLRNGRVILLRTAPLDPSDPMRGYYARFRYDFSSVSRGLWRGGLPSKIPEAAGYIDNRQLRDTRVYALLRVDDSGFAELESLSDRVPSGGVYLAGRVDSASAQLLNVRFGIEALFMQQGKSARLEKSRATERIGAPIDVEVAVSPSGLAVLKGYTWEPLGITVTFERGPAQQGRTPGSTLRGNVTAAKVRLVNYGPNDVAVVDLPEGGSFRLVAVQNFGQEIRYHWVGENQPAPPPGPESVFVLKPGQSRETRLDLTQARWFVAGNGSPKSPKDAVAIRDIKEPWSASFRLEYSPPGKGASAGLPHSDIIRHEPIRSRAFNPANAVD